MFAKWVFRCTSVSNGENWHWESFENYQRRFHFVMSNCNITEKWQKCRRNHTNFAVQFEQLQVVFKGMYWFEILLLYVLYLNFIELRYSIKQRRCKNGTSDVCFTSNTRNSWMYKENRRDVFSRYFASNNAD